MNTTADVIPNVLVLAAMERAERHRARGHSDVPIWTILEHLDIPRRSAIARRVRSQIGALGVRPEQVVRAGDGCLSPDGLVWSSMVVGP
jgi:hypothetical protein